MKERHDQVLQIIASYVTPKLQQEYPGAELLWDLKDNPHHYHDVPQDLTRTLRRPDGLLINREEKWVKIFELTVPAIHNMEKRHVEKTDKYIKEVASQIQAKGYEVEVLAFEVSTLGFVGESLLEFLINKFKNRSKRSYSKYSTIYSSSHRRKKGSKR